MVSKVISYNGSDYEAYAGNNIKGIESFSFEIPELAYWLDIPSVEFAAFEDGTAVIHELSIPTIILQEDNPKVYIKYEIKNFFDGIENQNEMSIEKIPRIFVEFSTSTNDIEVSKIIEMLMRFFSLLIGKISTADDIKLMIEGRGMVSLFLNRDFSVNINRNEYNMSYRTKYKDVIGSIPDWFKKWNNFFVDNSFKFIQDAFFNTCSKKVGVLEEIFLTYCRFLEGYDLRVSKDEEKADSLNKLLEETMNDKTIKDILSPKFKEVGSKYNFKNVSKLISSGFLGRISLEARIERLDKQFYRIIDANNKDIKRARSTCSFYSQIAKTRNYYSHFKSDSTDILTINQIYYSLPVLKAVITTILMAEMGIDTEIIKLILVEDDVFWTFASHLRPEEKVKS